MTRPEVFSALYGVGPIAEAEALVCPVTFSPRYDLDRELGVFSRKGHPLEGVSISGRILVCPGVQGGVAAGWAMLAMRGRGVGFAGLVFGQTNPAMVQGAVAARIPILAGTDEKIFSAVRSGDFIRVDPKRRQVTLVSGAPTGSRI